jgi:type I restriction-modification system DNA methylase subunit
MSQITQGVERLVEYVRKLSGDEKSEAQVFCDRLFQAFGHPGYKEAGATLEYRLKTKGKITKFPDLVWKPRLLMEMKSRGEKLQRHYGQAFEYWLQLVPNRPKYMVLCNFDEFWIYDFDLQLNDPIDIIPTEKLPERYTAFNFLLPEPKEPLFNNNRAEVTKAAADKVARVFNSLVARGEDRDRAQRFVLQCVVAMFAEDTDLLPRGLFTELIHECRCGGSSFDLIGSLFRQMDTLEPARGGRFKGVRYFDGGIFRVVDPIDLTGNEIELLDNAATENWSKVQPPIFGTLFESSMGKAERHTYGAHYTSEADIQKVVLPTIVRPWRERIEAASTLKDLRQLREELLEFHVLDPACGSGNFLYVAYRELKRIEFELLTKIHDKFKSGAREAVGSRSLISVKQFHGIEKNKFGVELAKVTLVLAKELTIGESRSWFDQAQLDLPLDYDVALPLENLDENIVEGDALFCTWPKVQAIIGNPPYQPKNKAQGELGPAYLNKLRKKYPSIPGRADYCVYWFCRAHDEIPERGHVGLVGTNTIRQNYSRIGGLDHVVKNGGTITEAVSSQVWSGDAAVNVAIVNWVKGDHPGKKKLYTQLGDRRDSPWEVVELDKIGSSLSASLDVTMAIPLRANSESDTSLQGVTHGHKGFLLSLDQAATVLSKSPKHADVLFPYFIMDDLVEDKPPRPSRYVIDFHPRDVIASGKYPILFNRVKEKVLKKREEALEKEKKRNEEAKKDDPKSKVNRHHQNFLKKWWLLSYPRAELIAKISKLPRYIVCGRVTKRPIFEFVHPSIRPGDALQVFTFDDDYSFGILQSGVHWKWFVERCSTLKRDFRYTSDTVYDTFPWPQKPKLAHVQRIADAAVKLRALRRKLMAENNLSLRELYRTMDFPGASPLKTAQEALDKEVRAAYGMKAKADPLAFLLDLNLKLAEYEASMKPVVKPGLLPVVKDPKPFITTDCIRM